MDILVGLCLILIGLCGMALSIGMMLNMNKFVDWLDRISEPTRQRLETKKTKKENTNE